MPELPEVETTVRGLNKKIIGTTIKDVWTDWPKYFTKGSKKSSHLAKSEKAFKKCVKNKEITGVRRIGKNIIIELSDKKAILVHQKMTGHLIIGSWKKRPKKWKAPEGVSKKWENEIHIPGAPIESPLWQEKNRFMRLIFFLDNGEMIGLSDMRRFAKVIAGEKTEILESSDITNLGPEPIDPSFSLEDFKKRIKEKRGVIKSLLLNQSFVSGVGNIYADESLWMSKIHPLTTVDKLTDDEIEELYKNIVSILKKAVQLKGTSTDDYRDPEGNKGKFAEQLKVYQREDEECVRCDNKIKRIKIGARSAHFCPNCQKKK